MITADIAKIPIDQFIIKFRTKFGEFGKDTEESIRSMYCDGFCYYFANILAEAYPGGYLCKPWPIGHFVYQYNDKYWDIEGEYDPTTHECEAMIPFRLPFFISEEYIELHKLDYLHTVDYDNLHSPNVFNKYQLQLPNSLKDININVVELDKSEQAVLVFLIYRRIQMLADDNNLRMLGPSGKKLYELPKTDEDLFKTVSYYYKWIELEELINLDNIAKKLCYRYDEKRFEAQFNKIVNEALEAVVKGGKHEKRKTHYRK